MSMRKKGEKSYTAPHVRLYFAMLISPAWKYIPPAAKCLYIEILKEWAGGDENEIELSYSVVKNHLGFSSPTISRAFIYLDKFGFLKRKHQGGLFQNSSIYALSDEWKVIKSDQDVEAATAAAISELNLRRKIKAKGREKESTPLLGNYKYEQKLTLEGGRKPVHTALETNAARLETNAK